MKITGCHIKSTQIIVITIDSNQLLILRISLGEFCIYKLLIMLAYFDEKVFTEKSLH